jgi:hypothetical protein
VARDVELAGAVGGWSAEEVVDIGEGVRCDVLFFHDLGGGNN